MFVAVGTAVFVGSNVALPMLELSRQYGLASTESQRLAVQGAGAAMLARSWVELQRRPVEIAAEAPAKPSKAVLVAVRLIGCVAERHRAPDVVYVPQPTVSSEEYTASPQNSPAPPPNPGMDEGATELGGGRIVGENVSTSRPANMRPST